MSWSFELSLAVFLAVAFASQALSTLTRSRLTLQFWLGVICIAGFAAGLLPPEFVEKSRMREVGVIAFNVLVVHSGTMIDPRAIREQWRAALLCGAVLLAVIAAVGFGLAPIVGPALAAASPGPVLGGGAAAAIASNALAGSRPELAAYPWLLFMVQCIFGLPLFSWALGKAARRAAGDAREGGPAAAASAGPGTPSEIVPPAAARPARPAASLPGSLLLPPERYRTTAYYLGSLMIVSLFNKWLYSTFLSGSRIGYVVTALLLGIALRGVGAIERDPLGKSDSFGLLMLGLMALMANALAKASIATILRLLPVVLLVFVLGSLVVAAVGALAGRFLGLGAWGGVAVAAACMVGLPLAASLVGEEAARAAEAAAVVAPAEGEGRRVAGRLLPPVAAAASLVGNVLSIALASLSAAFL